MPFDYFLQGVHHPGVESSPEPEPPPSEPEGAVLPGEAAPPYDEEPQAPEAVPGFVDEDAADLPVDGLPPVPFRVRQRYHREETPKARLAGAKGWLAWREGTLRAPTILLAALLAHGLCVQAIFYQDDWPQIVANDWVSLGSWWEAGQRALTYFTYWLTYALFGMSAPAFHAGNLLIHGVVAVAVGGFARAFLVEAADLPPERAERIGWWAGLLFAVHPLCSEVLNYTHARDLELVTLFSVLAARAALRWRRQLKPGHRWPMATMLAVGAATFCKETGFILAAGSAALVFLATRKTPQARTWQPVAMPLPGAPKMPKTKLVVAPKDAALIKGNWPVTFSLALVALCLAVVAWPAWRTAYAALHHPRLGWHALTKARVFWMYVQRLVAPVGLCSDHQIAWTTTWDDPAAWLATAGMAALIAGVAVLLVRGRGAVRAAGVLAALVLMNFLHRLANPTASLMVEARVYPAMWPLCVLIAWAIGAKAAGSRQQAAGGDGGDRLLAVRWVVVGVLVITGIVLSEQRAQVWGRRETLVKDVLAQYPLQGRAYQEVQDADVRAGHWTETLKDQLPIRAALNGAVAFNLHSKGRKYAPDELLLVHVQSEGNYALALTNLGHQKEAIAQMIWLQKSLQEGRQATRELNAALFYAGGRVNEALGSREEAISNFRQSVQSGEGMPAERELRKLEAER